MAPKGKVDPKKPYRWRRWRLKDSNDLVFFTCARPGRISDPNSRFANVPDEVVKAWAQWIADLAPVTVVSMLGVKDGGKSEFSFYTFWGGTDDPSIVGKKRSFADVLTAVDPQIELLERPTTDGRTLQPEQFDDICGLIQAAVAPDHPVVLVDSGGQERTGAVAEAIAVEDFSNG